MAAISSPGKALTYLWLHPRVGHGAATALGLIEPDFTTSEIDCRNREAEQFGGLPADTTPYMLSRRFASHPPDHLRIHII